jgi:predicted RecA/RadA family phage recombinase
MSARFVQDGEFLDYTPGGAVDAGVPVVFGDRVFVTPRALAANELGSVQTRGVWFLTKHAGEAWAMGAKLYWDNGNSRVTTTASSHKVIGYAAQAALSADTTGFVMLGQ